MTHKQRGKQQKNHSAQISLFKKEGLDFVIIVNAKRRKML